MLEMLTIFTLLSASMFFMVVNPLFTSLFLILFSIFSSTMLLIKKMNWIFMATIIMFLGGMMVVFVYASSLSSNKKLIILKQMKEIVGNFLILMTVLFILKSNNFYTMDFQVNPGVIYKETKLGLLLIMAFYLLLTLLLLVKIIRWKEGPLKSQFK